MPNEGVTLVIDKCSDGNLYIHHAECVGAEFNPEIGVQVAVSKPAERFPYNAKYSMISHVVYMLAHAKRRHMAHLQPLRRAMQALLETRPEITILGIAHCD